MKIVCLLLVFLSRYSLRILTEKRAVLDKDSIIKRIMEEKFPKKKVLAPQKEATKTERKLSLTLYKNTPQKETQKPARKEAEIDPPVFEPYNPITLAFIGNYDLKIKG